MSAPVSPNSAGTEADDAPASAPAAVVADGSGSDGVPALLRPAPKAAAQSEVSATIAAGTIGVWPQGPATEAPPPQPPSDRDALFAAVSRGDLDTARRLIDEVGVPTTVTDDQGNTLVHTGVCGGSIDLMRYLVDEKRLDVNASDNEFRATPLFWAISNRRLEMIVFLVARGADARHTDSNRNSVLHAAVHSGSIAALAFLLSTQLSVLGNSVDILDTHGMTPLMWAAYQSKQDILELLLRLGASVNMQDGSGKSALHYAMMNGYPSAKVALLEKGANPDLKDFGTDSDHNGAQSPREIATAHGYLPAFEGYIRKGASLRDLTSPGYTVLGRSLRKEICAAVLPLVGLCVALGALSLYPWFLGVPFALAAVAAMHYSLVRFITRRRQPPQILRLPYISSIFQWSALLILITWVTRVLPVTTRGQIDGHSIPTHRLLNVVFMWLFGSCMYFFYATVFADPGFIPRNEDIQAAEPVVRRLAEAGRLDSENFCFSCLNKRPLRSKHCRYAGRCVARFDHYCPWAYNVVGLGNHREFVVFLALLASGISVYVVLVSRYMDSVFTVYDPIPGQPCYLSNNACGMFQADAWVLVTTVWISLNLIWVAFLLGSDLYMIALGCTTNEMLTGFLRVAGRPGKGSGHTHGHAPRKRGKTILNMATRLGTLIVGIGGTGGGDDPLAAATPSADSGDAQPPPIAHSNSETSDELLPQNRAGGQAMFALHSMGGYSQLPTGIDADKLKTAPYSFGLVSNYLDFWTRGAKGRLAGTDWREVMDIVELAPYRPPSVPQFDEDDAAHPAHMSLAVAAA
ncbi:palmitoyltransferase akr1 [Coemansia spiralis]|nr:palmitoyltransferase akr1 [Coemansia spiralis]